MKTIPLTLGKVAIVDDEDFEHLNQFKWSAIKDGNIFYARRRTINGSTKSMHREILFPLPGFHADHINGDGLDNRRRNLRIVTNQKNQMNRGAQKNNKLGVKGVSFHSRKKKYQSQIKANGKVIALGYFKTVSEASDAYKKASAKFFGIYANQ